MLLVINCSRKKEGKCVEKKRESLLMKDEMVPLLSMMRGEEYTKVRTVVR